MFETIDFRSDTVTLPTEEMLDAIKYAKLGDDVFKEDPTVNKLEQLAAEKMGKEAALLVTSGTQSSISAFALMGFTLDKTGSNSYESDNASGFFYEPQFLLQNFVDFQDNVKTAQASVNESASGLIEVVSFGKNEFMECNITLATDITPQSAIKENANGVSDLRDFLNYAINKHPIEFVYDLNNPDIYEPCLLEKTQSDTKGTGFKLYELYARKLVGYFETKTLTFRKIR